MECSDNMEKNRDTMPGLDIPIVTAENVRVGKLSAFTDATLADSTLIEMLTSWRNRYRQFFLTQFEATVPRTLQWLEHTVLADPTRLMFLIHDLGDEPVGHVGVMRLDEPIVELDNMIRGRSGGDGQLIYWAEVTLLRWLFQVRKVSGVCLHVLSNNWIPISIHSEIGFRMTEASPLIRRELSGENQLLIGTVGGEKLKAKLVRMDLSADDFLRFLDNKWKVAYDVEG
jgi:hypothetical protein